MQDIVLIPLIVLLVEDIILIQVQAAIVVIVAIAVPEVVRITHIAPVLMGVAAVRQYTRHRLKPQETIHLETVHFLQGYMDLMWINLCRILFATTTSKME